MSSLLGARAPSFGLASPCPPFSRLAARARGTPRLGGAEFWCHWGVFLASEGPPLHCLPPFLGGNFTSCIRAYRPPLPVLHIRSAQSVPPSSLPFQGGQWSSLRSPYPLAPPPPTAGAPPEGWAGAVLGLRRHFPLPPCPPYRLQRPPPQVWGGSERELALSPLPLSPHPPLELYFPRPKFVPRTISLKKKGLCTSFKARLDREK